MNALMRTIFAVRRAVWLCAAGSLLTACGGAQPATLPLSAQPSDVQDAGQKAAGDLLYVGANRTVEVFTFPDGTNQGAFEVPGPIDDTCSDSKGNVFVTMLVKTSGKPRGFIYEYAHGGTSPIATLNAPDHNVPLDCSSDPTTGNLAVTNQNIENYTPSVAVYAKASGKPKIYKSPALDADPQCGYDNGGNLFVTSSGNIGAELPKGKLSFNKITLDRTLGIVKHVQWDGKYFALQSFEVSHRHGEKLLERVYRFQVSGSIGKIVGTSYFDGWPEKVSGDSWLQTDTIVATPLGEIGFWKYPAGGKAFKTIHPSVHADAVTVSIGP